MARTSPADRIFVGGAILTMEEAAPAAEAIAVRGARIVAIGSRDEIAGLRGSDTVVTDLGGMALLPGFVDGHGHLAKLAANFGSVNLAGPPVGPIETLDGLVAELRLALQEAALKPGEWLQGRGYDPAFLAEGRHPTRHDLDRVSEEHPIYITHVSGHLAVANSLGLRLAGVDASTPDPPGGVMRREPGGAPDGVLEEAAMGFFTRGLIPPPSPEVELQRLRLAQETYASHGITTAQEGAMFPLEQALFERAAASGDLYLDVAGYAFWATARASLEGRPAGEYAGRFKLAGMKLMLDGSPQGKTAWLTAPYFEPPPGQPQDYRGYPAMPDEQAEGLVRLAAEQGWQVIAHCNGDAAADQFLAAIRKAGGQAGPGRPVMIHAQTVREDQLDAMAELGVLPSFFASHVYYWGDYHRDSVLGPERARRISPLRSALERGIRFNLHNDAPVVPPDIMRLVRCAVERRTRSGQLLGGEQRIGIMAAMKAVTLDAAYAHFEESSKGSIAIGKRADLVVLDRDPASTDPSELESVQIVETIKDGQTIFGRSDKSPGR